MSVDIIREKAKQAGMPMTAYYTKILLGLLPPIGSAYYKTRGMRVPVAWSGVQNDLREAAARAGTTSSKYSIEIVCGLVPPLAESTMYIRVSEADRDILQYGAAQLGISTDDYIHDIVYGVREPLQAPDGSVTGSHSRKVSMEIKKSLWYDISCTYNIGPEVLIPRLLCAQPEGRYFIQLPAAVAAKINARAQSMNIWPASLLQGLMHGRCKLDITEADTKSSDVAKYTIKCSSIPMLQQLACAAHCSKDSYILGILTGKYPVLGTDELYIKDAPDNAYVIPVSISAYVMLAKTAAAEGVEVDQLMDDIVSKRRKSPVSKRCRRTKDSACCCIWVSEATYEKYKKAGSSDLLYTARSQLRTSIAVPYIMYALAKQLYEKMPQKPRWHYSIYEQLLFGEVDRTLLTAPEVNGRNKTVHVPHELHVKVHEYAEAAGMSICAYMRRRCYELLGIPHEELEPKQAYKPQTGKAARRRKKKAESSLAVSKLKELITEAVAAAVKVAVKQEMSKVFGKLATAE